jgi:hypothetical protein
MQLEIRIIVMKPSKIEGLYGILAASTAAELNKNTMKIKEIK